MARKRLSVISTLLLYVCAGIPVWWRLTSVHRPVLPADDISEAVRDVAAYAASPVLGTVILTALSSSASTCVPQLESALQQRWSERQLNVLVRPQLPSFDHDCRENPALAVCRLLTSPEAFSSMALADQDHALHVWISRMAADLLPSQHQVFLLPPATVPGTVPPPTPTLGRHRHSWVATVPGDCAATVDAVLRMLGTEVLGGRLYPAPLPLSAASDVTITFSLCNGQPGSTTTWDFPLLLKRHLAPMFAHLNRLANVAATSQVLYNTTSPLRATFDAAQGAHVLQLSQASGLLGSLWRLDAGANAVPSRRPDGAPHGVAPHALHCAVYLPPLDQRPLKLMEGEAPLPSNSYMLESWGGVVVLNPKDDPANGGPVRLSDAELAHVAACVVAHMRGLLGLAGGPGSGALALQGSPSGFSEWEVDRLARVKAVGDLREAAALLASLVSVVEELRSLEIPDLVGSEVATALEALNSALAAARAGEADAAVAAAAQARLASEIAFSHPAILSQLNFPGQHKVAMYLPFFFPVGLVLLQGLVGELRARPPRSPRASN